jgi:hypothetical protein
MRARQSTKFLDSINRDRFYFGLNNGLYDEKSRIFGWSYHLRTTFIQLNKRLIHAQRKRCDSFTSSKRGIAK